METSTSNNTGYIVSSVLTTYASTYSELKDRKEELIRIKLDLISLDHKITSVQQDTQMLNSELPKLNTPLSAIENTLTQMNSKLDSVVAERKWYKTAAGFVITASASIIIFLISYSSEISAIKQLLNQFIEMSK